MPNIRSLQHYLYCPYRYVLTEIERQWSENFFTVNAQLAHSRVHSGNHGFSDSRKYVCSNVTVYNDEYDLYGVVDCLEFIRTDEKDDRGTYIADLDGYFKVQIVEYKPTAPHKGIREADILQVYAQKICVDGIWNCNADMSFYYSDIRRREKVSFGVIEAEYYNTLLNKVIFDIKGCIESKSVNAPVKTAKCNGCSFIDTCMPKIGEINVRELIGV